MIIPSFYLNHRFRAESFGPLSITEIFGGKYLQKESDGPASGLALHQSHRAETKNKTSLDCVLQYHHCVHFHWGEVYIVLKLSDYIYSEILEPERKLQALGES